MWHAIKTYLIAKITNLQTILREFPGFKLLKISDKDELRAGQSVHFFSMALPLLVTWKNQYGVTVTRYFSRFLRRYRYRYM